MDNLKIVKDPKTIATIAELDTICFGEDSGFKYYIESPDQYGATYALWKNESLIGYTVYGQIWLPENQNAYISSIGVHPKYQQQGYGLWILKQILTELSNRLYCPNIHADIRKSNLASQALFKKAGFHLYCEHDVPYDDEIAMRVVKNFKRQKGEE